MTQLYAVLQSKTNPNDIKHIKVEELVNQQPTILEHYAVSEILEEDDL